MMVDFIDQLHIEQGFVQSSYKLDTGKTSTNHDYFFPFNHCFVP